MGKKEKLRFNTEMKVVHESINRLNSEFSLCDVLVAYPGKNRNYTWIEKEAFEKAKFSLYGIPIVGEWLVKSEDQNVGEWGSHGGKITIDSEGIKFEETTKPYGFVTQEAQENAEWVTITEKNGHEENEYLLLKKCILWTGRYPETETILEKNYGQSMEIIVTDGEYAEDGNYLKINEFLFSALCILGDDHEPCFESASIGPHKADYSMFKNEFTQMFEKYEEFMSQSKTGDLNKKGNTNSIATNNKKNESEGKELDKEKVLAKLKSVFSKMTYRSNADKHYEKYEVFHVDSESNTVFVVDREDNYKVYSIPFMVTETEEDLVVTPNLENKVEKFFTVGDENCCMNIQNEINKISEDVSNFKVGCYSSKTIQDLEGQLQTTTEAYNIAKGEIERLSKQVGIYEKEKNNFIAEKKKAEVDSIVAIYSSLMGKFSDFMKYEMEIDYSKSVEEVEKELKIMYGDFMIQNNKQGKNAASFNLISNPVIVVDEKKSGIVERYGEEFANFIED